MMYEKRISKVLFIVELRKIVQQNSYKVVSVSELIEHLNNGWEIVKEVGGSQVIIRKAKI